MRNAIALPARPLRAWIVGLACSACTMAVFWSVQEGQFLWDDYALIINNTKALDSWADAAGAFRKAAVDRESVGYYRPILIASYVVDWQLWGNLPGAFHRTDVILHGANVALAWAVLYFYLGSMTAATVGALAFGVHPVQTQAVALILGRNDLLLFIPFAVGLYGYRAWHLSSGAYRRWWSGIVVLAYGVACWTKETGIILPLVLVAADRMVFGLRFRDLSSRRGLFVALAAVGGAYLVVRSQVLGTLIGAVHYHPRSVSETLLRVVAILGYYVCCVVLPYGYAATPFHSLLVDPSTSSFWLAALACLAVSAVLIGLMRVRIMLAFGLVVFLLCLLPVSGLIPMKLMILEHRLYVPMIGVAFFVGTVVAGAPVRRGLVVAFAIPLIACLAGLTFNRLPTFRNALALWSSTTRTVPGSAYARHEYGFALVQANQDAEAIAQFREAVRLSPGFDLPRYKLALALERQGQRGAGIAQLRALLRNNPRHIEGLNALGVFLKRDGDLIEAEAALRSGLRVDDQHPALLRNLANVLRMRERFPETEAILRQLLQIEPRSADLWLQLGRTLYTERAYEQARDAFSTALELGLETRTLHSELSLALAALGQDDLACKHATRAEALGHSKPRLRDKIGRAGQDP